MKVFITRKLPGNVEKTLREKGFKVSTFNKDRAINANELIENAKNAEGLITLLTDKIDKNIIDQLNKCKVIANYAVGYNNIDVEYAKSKEITVTNTPGILTDATADLAVALTLAASRKIVQGENFVRNNKFKGWKPDLLLGIELKGKTVGILGAGRIGQETAKRLKVFGTKIIYYNRSRKENFEEETGAQKISLNKLLKVSDIISLHLPLTDKTFHLLNKDNLCLLKKTAILINTARGEIIDEDELITMLKKKKIFAAGFDVYEGEPKINPELLKLDNTVLLPHIGSATFETRTKMAQLCAKNVMRVLTGDKPITPV